MHYESVSSSPLREVLIPGGFSSIHFLCFREMTTISPPLINEFLSGSANLLRSGRAGQGSTLEADTVRTVAKNVMLKRDVINVRP